MRKETSTKRNDEKVRILAVRYKGKNIVRRAVVTWKWFLSILYRS